MRKFYVLSEDRSELVPGKIGVSSGYIDAPEGVIETDDPWVIAELESYAATAGHPVSEVPPPKQKPSKEE